MVKLHLYGDTRATCTQKVLILLEELSVKYSFEPIDILKGEHKTPEFLELQPFGVIPAMIYGDRTLFESRSILRYIAKNNTDIEDFFGDVDVDIWLEAESQNYNPAISKIVNEKLFKKWRGEECDDKIVEDALLQLEKVLDIYENRLSTFDFIGGNSYSIADISHIPYTNYLLKCGYKSIFKSRPHVYKWLKRIMKRDNVKLVLEM
jgi:glutathione S-transferase